MIRVLTRLDRRHAINSNACNVVQRFCVPRNPVARGPGSVLSSRVLPQIGAGGQGLLRQVGPQMVARRMCLTDATSERSCGLRGRCGRRYVVLCTFTVFRALCDNVTVGEAGGSGSSFVIGSSNTGLFRCSSDVDSVSGLCIG